ncbi:MAG: hypothetical protein JRI39_12700 [Deltaproteobacteria bacterium]|nr:hypothetical protein [Deltaproteobacteria bacterium]MBW2083904.1 hypothetical protein [Deltaproteobacteria bacterium]HDM09551.1 hypothetical protein [Desulfobacteraceae bacterium]
MNTRRAIFAFSQGEKIKAGLIWTSHLIGALDSTYGGDRHETRQVGRALLEMVRQDVHLATRIAEDQIWNKVDDAIERALVMIDSGVMTESVTHLTTALSHVTTIIQRAMQFLQEKGLLK